MFAGVHATYELRRIPCLRACVSGVGGALQRCVQECRQDAWESRHAYLRERKASAGSWSRFPDEPEVAPNQSTWNMKMEVWKARSLDSVSRGAIARAMPL